MSYIGKPKVNGQNVALSNTNATNNLAIIRVGFSDTGILAIGEGATCVHSTTGTYTLSWSSAFADAPVVVANVATTTSGINALIVAVKSISTTGCVVIISNTSSSLTDSDFNLIAIGQL